VVRLHVRVRPRLVADGLDDDDHSKLDLTNCGRHLKPDQWHHTLDNKAMILDVRNWFENEVGHFENAQGIPVDSFRDTFPYVDQLLAKHTSSDTTSTTDATKSQPKLMIYCTGYVL
jgi:UPF0176 protein